MTTKLGKYFLRHLIKGCLIDEIHRITRNRKEVLYITFRTRIIASKVMRWHVSHKMSMAVHNPIKFNKGIPVIIKWQYRAPKRMGWEGYSETIEVRILGCIRRENTAETLQVVNEVNHS